MITKNRRLAIILDLVNTHTPSSQGKLLSLLHEKGFVITQTTLSRDIKQLKISKMPDDKGNYIYKAPHQETNIPNRGFVKDKVVSVPNKGFISIDFSYNLVVIKIRPGYADGIALDIKTQASSIILGTIAGEDTILLIPRENVTRQGILDALAKIIPGIKEN